jgi:hypothetical protein
MATPTQSTAALKEIENGVNVTPEDAAQIWEVLDTYLYNYRQPVGDYLDKHVATCHFPHVRIASHQVLVMPKPEDYMNVGLHVSDFMQEGWDHSEWVTRKITQADPEKVHVNVTFNRYTKDQQLINVETSFYILEKIDGRWGVRGRSSFAK